MVKFKLQDDRLKIAFFLFVLCLIIILVYIRGVENIGFTIDDLKILEHAREYGPWSGLLKSAAGTHYSHRFFRPVFVLQGWILYQLFGMNPLPSHLVIICLHTVSILIIWHFLHRITKNVYFSALIALLFSAHLYVTPLIARSVTDTLVLTAILISLVVIMLLQPSENFRWYFIFFILLFLLPFSRENGIAFVGSVMVYALVGFFLKRFSLRKTLLLIAMSLVPIGSYMALRIWATGAVSLDNIISHSSLVSTHYEASQVLEFSPIKRLSLFAYTVFASFIAIFAPMFSTDGGWGTTQMICNILSVAALITTDKWIHWKNILKRHFLILFGFLIVILMVVGTKNTYAYYILTLFRDSSIFLLSFLLIQQMPKTWQRLTADQKIFLSFSFVSIVASSVIVFPYFRYRNLRYGLIGWMILLAFTWAKLDLENEWERDRQKIIVLLLISTIILNVYVATISPWSSVLI